MIIDNVTNLFGFFFISGKNFKPFCEISTTLQFYYQIQKVSLRKTVVVTWQLIGPKAYLGKEDNFAIIMISSSLAYFLTTRPAKLTRFSFFILFLVTIAATRRKRGVFVPAVVSPSSMKREVFGGFWRFEKT